MYLAECIDLDISVHGGTPSEAHSKLVEAIIGYLKTVASGDTTGLLLRPSPFNHRLRYYCYCFKAALARRNRNFQLFDWHPPESDPQRLPAFPVYKTGPATLRTPST